MRSQATAGGNEAEQVLSSLLECEAQVGATGGGGGGGGDQR